MNTAHERRRFTRVRFDTAATIAQQGTVLHTHVLDISLNGILLETPENYNLRSDMPANINISLSDQAEIQMHVRLVHSASAYLGFHCESIDMESAGHLRKLVELNMNDPNAPERVLDELVTP